MKISQFKLLAMNLFIIAILSLSPIVAVQGDLFAGNDETQTNPVPQADWKDGIDDSPPEFIDPNAGYAEDQNMGDLLSDNDNTAGKKWDPWLTKAAIHAIATTDDGDMMALAGGFLYDNQIHLYRWNYQTDQYDLVSEIGGGIFRSDVMSLDFADVDYNNLTEIIAGGEDGRFYVFEQRHLYDPYTNSENTFDLVYESPRLGRVFDIIVADTDKDYRQDIIVGTGNTVRWYEYDTHGSYPFGEDHFITFREVFNYTMPSQVTALGISDVDYDGLPEVAVGMRSGEIQLLENDGTTLMINGYPYPITQDNKYRFEWSSGTLIQRDISDISGGDIDDDNHAELMIAVQGQGAYVLDNIDGNIAPFRIERPFASWESNLTAFYSLDIFTDSMVNSSSWFNNTDLPLNQANVYQTNNGTTIEPLNYTLAHFEVYPFNSFAVRVPDQRYTTFDAGKIPGKSAWAIFDFGNDEEAAGNGAPTVPELEIYIKKGTGAGATLELSISEDNSIYHKINSSYITLETVNSTYDRFLVEVDPTIATGLLTHYRYLNLTVTSGKVEVDTIITRAINNPIYDALSTEVGPMQLKNQASANTVGFIGTIDGTILAVDWNPATKRYEIVWDSWRAERYKLQKNIFDLELIKKSGTFPAWINYGLYSTIGSYSNGLYNPIANEYQKLMSYTAANFYNYRQESSSEFILITDSGQILAARQSNPTTQLVVDATLSNMLFNTTFAKNKGGSDLLTVQEYINIRKGINPNAQFAASLVPFETNFYDSNRDILLDAVDSGWLLILGEWSGSVGLINPNPYGVPEIPNGVNELTVWYLDSFPGFSACPAGLEECSGFVPLTDTGTFPDTFSQLEYSGQLENILRESTWFPKVASGDFIGDETSDFVLTNGKLHLIEVAYTELPNSLGAYQNILLEKIGFILTPSEPLYQFPLTQKSSELSLFYKGDYFKEINDQAKGRQWTDAQVVNFDNDDDFDLILGFASYNSTLVNFEKRTFGMTYWENEGTKDSPIWVEKKKAVTNNDPDSNFRVHRYGFPVLIYDNYDFEDLPFTPPIGYHPYYRDLQPTRLIMLQQDDKETFEGILTSFTAEYNHGTSLLAATYPEAKRVDINLKYSDSLLGGKNFGFHIFETWNNEEELRDWTLSMSTADLDEDGKNEVIVGDFNNNIYVFEHLSNNTFKRAYKSFDVNHTVQDTNSPYGHEKFGGINGTFFRTIYDHIRFLIAGTDLNNNSLQEFVAATDSTLFVFEATRTITGRIHDDTYTLIGTFDLFNFATLSNLAPDKRRITALSWGDDLTHDGRRELIVAIGSALLIFEISTSASTSSGEFNTESISTTYPLFNMEEIFYKQTYKGKGLYNVPGNYRMYPDMEIRSILVSDLDRDGRMDITIAGEDQRSARPIWGGFITILEWTGGTFSQMVDSDVFTKTTQFNPINDLDTDDTDYDGFRELIIGHDQGVDLYEFVGDNTAEIREVITSNPHYQIPQRSYYYPSSPQEHKDVLRLPNGTLIMVFVDGVGVGATLKRTYSYDNGNTWTTATTLSYTRFSTPITTSLLGIVEVSLAYQFNSLWLKFSEWREDTGSTDWYVFYIMKDPKSGDFAYPIHQARVSVESGQSASGRLFPLLGTVNEIGFVVYYPQLSTLYLFKVTSTGSYSLTKVPWANGTILGNHYYIHSLDIVQNPKNLTQYDLVFAGYSYNESLSLDLDLYYTQFSIFDLSNWQFNFTGMPGRIFESGISSFYPSVARELHTNNLVVVFQQTKLNLFDGLYSVWSNDNGISWKGPYNMNYPLGLDLPGITAFPSKSKESYQVGLLEGAILIDKIDTNRPIITATSGRGFTMTYNVKYRFQFNLAKFGLCGFSSSNYGNDGFSLESSVKSSYQTCSFDPMTVNAYAFAYNPWSNFTWYDLGSANKISIGDSDSDFRKEIIVASGKNAYLYEFKKNSADYILHVQKWVSPTYIRDITEVAISDANGNGLPEILVESDRGVVHSYEVLNAIPSDGKFLLPKVEKTITSTYNNTVNNYVISIVPVEIDNDGIEDFVYMTYGGQLVAISGATFSPLWISGLSNPSVRADIRTFSLLLQLIKDGSGTPTHAVMSFNDTLYAYKLSDGSLSASVNMGGNQYINKIQALNTTSGQPQDILLSTINGSIVQLKLDTSSFTTVFKINPFGKSPTLLHTFEFGHYTNQTNDEIAMLLYNGTIGVVELPSGTIKWTVNYPIETGYFDIIPSLMVADLNKDNLTDIIAGYNTTIAMDGLTGKQLWNTSIDPGLMNMQNSITDIDGDDIPELFFQSWSTNGLVVLSGASGKTLWRTPSPSVLSAGIGAIIRDFKHGSLDLTGLSSALWISSSKGRAFVYDAKSGVSMGGISLEAGTYSTALLSQPGNKTALLVGDMTGNVTVVSFWDDYPKPTAVLPPSFKETPFIKLGEEFTSRTQFFLYETFSSDGIDDVFVADDFFVGAADTGRLLNDPTFNEAEWTVDDLTLGEYREAGGLVDIDGNGQKDLLVLAFERKIVAYKLQTGDVSWERSTVVSDGNYVNYQMFIGQFDGTPGEEIIISRELRNFTTGIQYAELFYMKGDGSIPGMIYSKPNYANPVISVEDLNGDGKVEVLYAFRSTINPLIQELGGFSNPSPNMFSFFNFTLAGLPPVTQIPVGDFDDTNTIREFAWFFDFAALELGGPFAFLLDLFPSLILTLAADPASFNAIGVPSTWIGIAPAIGEAYDYLVHDIDGDGRDDLLVQTENNQYYNMYYKTGSSIITKGEVLSTIAVPYAEHSMLKGSFKTASSTSLALIASADTVIVYDSLNVSTMQPQFTVSVDIDIIQDVLPGTFDGDSITDLMIVSRNGYVWVVKSTQPSSLDLQGEKADNVTSEVLLDQLALLIALNPWIMQMLVQVFMLAVLLPVMKKKKMI